MMNAMIYDDEQKALDATANVQWWCSIHDKNRHQLPPIPFKGRWAVTYPEGYPVTPGTEIVDINAVEEVEDFPDV